MSKLSLGIECFRGTSIEKGFTPTPIDHRVKKGVKDGKRQIAENKEYLDKKKKIHNDSTNSD